MSKRLIDYTEDDANGTLLGAAGTDPWIVEVLLDTLAVALHLPLRLVVTPRFERACVPGIPLGDAIQNGFGDISTFRNRLRDVAVSACEGSRIVGNENAWNEVEKELSRLRAVITSNSDPFWTVMRGLDPFALWDIFWLLEDSLGGSDSITPMPEPFGTDFVVCKTTTPKFAFRLSAGPVWHWVSGTCGEPGVAPNGNPAVRRIVKVFADQIGRHHDKVAEGEPVGIFSEERLARNIMGRPPMLAADIRRRVRLATRALEHALCVVTDRPPRAVELVSMGMAALHLADRLEVAAVRFGPDAEIWHRLETGWEEGSAEPAWLVTKLIDEAGRITVGSSELHPGPPPTDHAVVQMSCAAPDSTDPDEMAFSHLMVDYAIGRSAYIRERMMIIRLWARDNFALWLTTPNLPETREYGRRVDDLASRIADIFVADRCGIFRYDAEQQTLERLGRFARDQADDTASRRESFERIRAAGTDRDRRNVSPRYQAIDEAKPIHLTESRDDSGRPEGQRPGSRLVVPIVIFGRPWGAIELVGLRSHQFLPSTTPWLDEFSRLLGPDLYVEGVLNDLHEISRSVLAKKGKHEQFRDVLGRFARIFVAGSGALYLRHPRRTTEFICEAFFGRPGDLPDGKLSGFNIKDPISKAAAILRGDRKGWHAGVIGFPPFDGEWAAHAKTRGLHEQGYKYIANISLRDGSDRVVGCITLAAREGGRFEERFQPLAEFATRYAGVAIEAIELKHNPDESKRELAAHSLKNRVDRVTGAADTLEKLLNNFFGQAGDAARVGTLLRDIELEVSRHHWAIDGPDRYGRQLLNALQRAFDPKGQDSFATVLSDVHSRSAELRRTAAYLAGDVSNEENPFETTETEWTGTATALRDCLLGSVMPVARKHGAEVVVPPPQELGSDVRLRVSPYVMSDIINNFCDNAIKYSASGSQTRIRFRWNKGSAAYLEFRNLAPRLTEDEVSQLYTIVFRSDYAESRSKDGQGRGLVSNRKLAERWKMKVIHRQESMELKAGTNVWHVFGVEIPKELIFEDITPRPLERSQRP